jgi:GntR family transcriptional regulator/MocR family aminotransferase
MERVDQSMPKNISSFELTLDDRQDHQTLSTWLYGALWRAILDGRLKAGTRLPATRDFARQYGVSRGIVVNVFEQLKSDGYLSCHVGAGTWVNHRLPKIAPTPAKPLTIPPKALPEPLTGLSFAGPSKPFRMGEAATTHFPAKTWARVASYRLRRLPAWLEVRDDGRGYRPLCEAVANYLATSRGVKCNADQIAIVSGVQQGLDLLSRLLLGPGDPVWMEDPGYFGATIAFRNAGAKIVPVPIDEQGISIAEGRRCCARPKGVYVTPGHQFPLGMTMSLERRLELIAWAHREGVFVIEDDYDGEFRFAGRPVPTMQSLDGGGNVIVVGTFNKLLFSSLRLGYVVLPAPLIEPFLALRFGMDLRVTNLDQAILCDFIVEGHLGRHIRRMRELYAKRLDALMDAGKRYLKGAMEIGNVRAGLYTAGFLRNGMGSEDAERSLVREGIETLGMHRFTMGGVDPCGVVLGFAAFDEKEIRRGVVQMARALERSTSKTQARGRG